MSFLKLYTNKIIFRQLFLVSIILSFSLLNISSFSQNSTNIDTKASLIITQTVFQVRLGVFDINPNEIYKGETLKFKLGRVTFEDGSTASNLPCKITITSPDSSIVVLEGLSDVNGECIYDTSRTLDSQGLTLISGDILKINSTIGQGTAFATITFNGNAYISNTDSYLVKAKTIIIGDFTINPESIFINDNLIFQLGVVRYSDGIVASNLPLTIILTAPNGGQITISGLTDSSGRFEFDLSKSLASQNIVLVSGNINNLNGFEGTGSGSAKIVYDGVTYTSNTDNYIVKNRIISDIPKIVTNLARTGGGVPFGIGIIMVLAGAIFMIKDSLKKRKNK